MDGFQVRDVQNLTVSTLSMCEQKSCQGQIAFPSSRLRSFLFRMRLHSWLSGRTSLGASVRIGGCQTPASPIHLHSGNPPVECELQERGEFLARRTVLTSILLSCPVLTFIPTLFCAGS